MGYVLRGCGDDIMTTLLNATLPNNDPGMEELSVMSMKYYFMGNTMLIIAVISVCTVVVQVSGPIAAFLNHDTGTNTTQPLYGIYGLFWGCVIVSAVGNILLSLHTIWIAALYLNYGDRELVYVGWVVLSQVVLGTLAVSLAIFFGRKLQFPIPVIFSYLCFLCTCCCNKEHALQKTEKIVQCLSLWSLLLFTVQLACNMSFVFLALLARPTTVISTLAMYLIFASYCIHLWAGIFAVIKERQPALEKRTTSFRRRLFQTWKVFMMFISLCGATIFFGILVTAANTYGRGRDSINAVLSTVITNMALGGITLAGHKVGSVWVTTVFPPSSTSEANEHTPLLERSEVQMEESTLSGGQRRRQTRQQYTSMT